MLIYAYICLYILIYSARACVCACVCVLVRTPHAHACIGTHAWCAGALGQEASDSTDDSNGVF